MVLSLNDKKIIQSAWQEILSAKKITLFAHYRPDGDCISACAALEHILLNLDKQVESIYPNKSEFKISRHPQNVLINEHKQTPDLLIVLDTANYERFYYPKDFESIPIINIDHHISNEIKGTYNFIDTNTSSTCEILAVLLNSWDKKLIDKYAAECLLFGILADSQVFHTQSVYPQTLRTAANLVELGANLYELKKELITDKDPKVIALWGHVMSNIKIVKEKAAIACISQEDLKKFNVGLPALIGFNNFLSQITGIDITLLFYEMGNGKTKVSLRSKETDVNKLAAKFGGGGHKNAAGIVSSLTIENLTEQIKKEL